VQTVVEAYLTRANHQIFVLNWSHYSDGNYALNAINNLIKIGAMMGSFFYTWFTNKVFNVTMLHIVGNSFTNELLRVSLSFYLPLTCHSLGGQLSGYIGRSVTTLSANTLKIKRITALDPAKPLFFTKLSFLPRHLSPSDAEFVDIIHTAAGSLGSDQKGGTVDFWVNGGSFQQGCLIKTEPLCDHSRSWIYVSANLN